MKDAAKAMRAATETVLAGLSQTQSDRVLHGFADPDRTRWSYTPRDHHGLSLTEMDVPTRKAFHRLLATALSRHAMAQAVTIMALEEVLDLDESGRKDRHSGGYYLAVFGRPGSPRMSWRIEGHHLSVTATIVGDAVAVGPVFLGANPHRVRAGRTAVLAPLGAEEHLARDLLASLPVDLHKKALITPVPPSDIRSRNQEQVNPRLIDPSGVPVAALDDEQRQMFAALLALYLERLAPPLRPSVKETELHFAFLGRNKEGAGHYYRITGPDLLIEYCNNTGDHAHTVLRTPGGDFGRDLITAGHRG
ncbi:DUF3500 domain-containing protein [Catenulispora yoronensis]|uniref:DUF3500 domain-containing protein n=2 Tax=Catenulispora yoronensis TaxID=450799 RepID=A0ABP5F782_9ACTN